VASKKQSKGPSPVRNLSEKQIRKIWPELKASVLLERLRVLQPSARWSVSGSRVSGVCPYHQDVGPSFHIYIDRGYAKCYGCQKFEWNPIRLWAKIRGIGQSDALSELRQTFGLKFLAGNVAAQLKSWDRNQLLKKKLMEICHNELVDAIANPNDPAHVSSKAAVDWLLNTRQVSKDTIPSLEIVGIMPPLAVIYGWFDQDAERENVLRADEATQQGTKAERFVSLTEDAKAYLKAIASNPGWVGSVVFRLDVAPDTIGRFKMRRPGTKDFIMLDDEYEEDFGYCGLGWSMYADLLGPSQKYAPRIYVVEGEFDALSTMSRQVQAGAPGFVVVSAGGSAGGMHVDSLRHFGYDEVVLVGDAPTKKGDEIVSHWLEHVKELRAKIFVGYDLFPAAGDPDELVLRYGLDSYQKALLDIKNRDIFQTPPEWVFEQVRPELENIPEEEIRFRIETAGAKGRLLRNTHECDAYVEMCAKTFGLPSAQLKREIVAREEDEPAFILRLVDVLSQVFFVIGQRASDTDRWLYLWHKEKREIKKIGIADDKSIEQEFGSILGPAYQFFQEKVGIPAFLEPTDMQKEGGKYLKDMDAACRWYYRQALIHLAQGVPDFDVAPHKGQGIHVIRDPNEGAPSLYLVNGREVYHGVYSEDGSLSWKMLEGPSHQGYIFDVGEHRTEDPWLPWIRTTEDLGRAHTIDPQGLWNRLYEALDKGWVFKNHKLVVEFLTAHLLATTVCNAFRRQVMVGFHADTSAGKSRLLMGLIGGKDFSRIHLIASTIGKASFTTAGLRQEMNNKTRPLALDEFEDEGDNGKKTRTIVETLDLFRNSVGEDNTHTQGSRGGMQVIYHLNFFVFMASIHKPRKVQDANRIIQIDMERKEGREDPVQILLQLFGQNALEELKRDLSIGLLSRIAEIQRMYSEIEKEYSKTGSKPVTVDTRYFEALFPALTIMKMLGKDYRKFVVDFCEANRENLATTAGHTDSMQIFYWIAQSPAFLVRSEDGKVTRPATLLQMLASPEYRSEINLSATGLYFDEPSNLLVVNWTMVVQMVLNKHSKYARETNIINLRELASRAANAVKPEELQHSGALGRLKSAGLLGVPLHHLSAFNISQLLRDMSNGPVVSTGTVTNQKKDVDNGDFGIA
jgi:hypothetical protein